MLIYYASFNPRVAYIPETRHISYLRLRVGRPVAMEGVMRPLQGPKCGSKKSQACHCDSTGDSTAE